MTPLFTIHAGEFAVGNSIQGKYPRVNLWVPARDTGIDLLVTDSKNQKTVSLQVKFSRDYPKSFQKKALRACSWFTLDRQKLATSKADYWVFVLMGFEPGSKDLSRNFVIIKPSELLAKLESIHGKAKTIRSYLWVADKNRCWDARGLKRPDKEAIARGQYKDDARDFSRYLDNWSPIKALNR